jgi:hypothetical protein
MANPTTAPWRPPTDLRPDGAFVVQLAADCDPAQGRYTGRVEHVVSGRHARFGSPGELFAFLARVLDPET